MFGFEGLIGSVFGIFTQLLQAILSVVGGLPLIGDLFGGLVG